jgi:hypothetical protein
LRILPFRFFILPFSLCLCLASCRFQSYRAAYVFSPGVTYAIRYGATLEAGGTGSRAYVSSAQAGLSLKALAPAAAAPAAAGDSARPRSEEELRPPAGKAELSLTVDSLAFSGSDRDAGEDRYMADRLRKYRARFVFSEAGQALALEEEPALPPVEFSTLNFGRWLLYCLPAFPAEAIGDGAQWTAEQPLLDKFHPGSKVVKTCRAVSVRKTGAGRILKLDIEVKVLLEDLGDAVPVQGPALAGKGEAFFNLDRGLPLSVDLVMQGDFRLPAPQAAGDSGAVAIKPLRLKERLQLVFLP